MPGGVVDTPRDEEKWEKAKQIAAKAGHAEDYAYIMGIYKKMKPDHSFKKTAHSKTGAHMGPTRAQYHAAIDKMKIRKKPGIRADDAATGLAAGTALGAGVSGVGGLSALLAKNPKLLSKYPKLVSALTAVGKRTPLAKAMAVGGLGGATVTVAGRAARDSAKKDQLKAKMHAKIDRAYDRRNALMRAMSQRRASLGQPKTASDERFAIMHDSRGRVMAQTFIDELEKIARVAEGLRGIAARAGDAEAKNISALGLRRFLPFTKEHRARASVIARRKAIESEALAALNKRRNKALATLKDPTTTDAKRESSRKVLEDTSRVAKGGLFGGKRTKFKPVTPKVPRRKKTTTTTTTTPKPEPAPKKPESSFNQAARLTGYGVFGAGGLYGAGKYYKHKKQKELEQMYGGGGGAGGY